MAMAEEALGLLVSLGAGDALAPGSRDGADRLEVLGGEVAGHGHVEDHDELAASVAALARHAIALDLDVLGMLAAGRHRHAHALVAQHALDVERAATHGLERRDVLNAVQVVTLTLEALSLLDVKAHDEVTRAVAADAGLAVSLDLEGLAGVDAGRDFPP